MLSLWDWQPQLFSRFEPQLNRFDHIPSRLFLSGSVGVTSFEGRNEGVIAALFFWLKDYLKLSGIHLV